MASKFKLTILDRPLVKPKSEISLSAFALLFSEIVQHLQHRVYSIPELHERLSLLGQQVGFRMLEVLCIREKSCKREIKLLNMLQFIRSVAWKAAKVSAHWHKGTTFVIKFEESVISREKREGK